MVQAYDSVWRQALYVKLNNLGFGGKTLQLIKSMYCNDRLRFLINGKFTEELFLTQGVKQGKRNLYPFKVVYNNIAGCNLSPLLFSIFISNLGYELNKTNLGLDLDGINVSAVFFADDICILGSSPKALESLMAITRAFFTRHRLALSEKKSKIMTYNASSGIVSFSSPTQDPIMLEQVLAFKYLGIPVSSSSYSIFKDFNTQVRKKARSYLANVLSLVKSGPDRTDLAYTLWTCCALPAILYGVEVMPLTQGTIDEVEKCQSQVGKFILQLPRSTASVVSSIDAGLKPVWAVVAERVLMYAYHLLRKPAGYWPRIAMNINIASGHKSPYLRYLDRWKAATRTSLLSAKLIKKSVQRAAIVDVTYQLKKTSTTTFAMSPPGSGSMSTWFRPKPWVSDSCRTKILSIFRACNASLGNRGPTKDGRFFKLCPLCESHSVTALNNEVRKYIFHINPYLLLYLGPYGHRLSRDGSIPEQL